eukprot:gene7737-7936_t
MVIPAAVQGNSYTRTHEGAHDVVRGSSAAGDSIIIGGPITQRSLLQQSYDTRWFNSVIKAKPTIACYKDMADGDPSKAKLSYASPSPRYFASTNIPNSRRNMARQGLCSVQPKPTGGWSFSSPYQGYVAVHQVIPQTALCDALNTWWSAAQKDATHRTELLKCFNSYWDRVKSAQASNGRANIKMYNPDNSKGDWWAAGDTAALSYLSASIMWNVGNSLPGPDSGSRPTSMPAPTKACSVPASNNALKCIDTKIVDRFKQVGATNNAVYQALSTAITAIQAVPKKGSSPKSVPTCTTFFKHFTAIANKPLEAAGAEYSALRPLNNFWRLACDDKSPYIGELPQRAPSPPTPAAKRKAVGAATMTIGSATITELVKKMKTSTDLNVSTAAAVWEPSESGMAWAVAAANKVVGPVRAAMPTSAADVSEATALWRSQASSSDLLTMIPYEGPIKALTQLKRSSPEVRSLLARARRQATAIVAQAEVHYNCAATAERSVAAASLAIAAAATGEDVSVQAADAALQQITDVSARFAWDGSNAYGFNIGIGGLVDQEVADAGWQMLYDALQKSLTWIDLQYLPLSSTALMDLSASYNVKSKTMTFSAFTGNYVWLLSLVRDPVKSTFGVDLPEDDGSISVPTTAVAISVSSKGLQQLSVGLGGSWTASAIAKRLGVSWAASDDLLTISAPSVVYTPIPVSLTVTMVVDIPALGVSQMTSSLSVVSKGATQLELFGQFQPIPSVNISSMILRAVNGSFQASASGMLAGIPMTISGQVNRNKTAGKQQNTTVSLALTASDVNVASILRQIFGPDGLVPDFLLEFLQGITFRTVSLTYNSAAPNKAKFGIVAVPDIDGAPALKAVLDAVGLNPDDVALRMGPSALSFGISKAYTLNLPAPFTGPGVATWSLAFDSATKGVVLGSSFSSAIVVPGVQDPIGMDIFASVSTSATNGLAVAFAGATTSIIVIESFSFIQFSTFNVSASLSVSPPLINQLTLAGGLSVIGVDGRALFVFDKSSGTLALQAEVSGIDLQRIVNAATGADIDLGPFNMQLDFAKISYSTVDIPNLNIPMGMFYNARFTWMAMRTDVAFALSSDGVDFAVAFNATEFSRVFNEEVLGRLDAALNAAGDAMQSAGSALMNSKQEAEAALQGAQTDVQNARAKVAQDLQVFNTAKAKAEADLTDAVNKVNAAQAVFDAAKKKALDDLERAKAGYASADQAFNQAKEKANTDLNNAKKSVDSAQRSFDNAVADANRKINDAQASVNSLWADYNYHATRCDGWPWNWDHCVAAGGLWTAYQTATGVLDVARKALNDVASGAVKATLDAAQQTLKTAQRAADDVLTGVQFASRQAAQTVLNTCQKAADDILRTAQAATLESAKAILKAADDVSKGVLTGAHFVALQASNAGLDVANGALKAAEASASATLGALNDALQAVGGALQSVKTADFLQLNTCSLAVRATKSRGVALGFGYDFTVANNRYFGQLFLSVDDPWTAILNALKAEIMKPLKSAFPAIAPYV